MAAIQSSFRAGSHTGGLPPVLLSSSHLPHCDYDILPVFLYYSLKIKMCLCVGGMGLRAAESSLGPENILCPWTYVFLTPNITPPICLE